jgi:lipoyl-dependent peroxiredoxin
MNVLYRARATSTGGRADGHAKTDDGKLDLKLDVPAEMGGSGGPGTNPEQLFACGYSACFLGALKNVAGKEKVRIPDEATVTAVVGFGARDDGEGFGLDIDLEIAVPGIDRETVEALVQKAHIVCPYSHATRGNVDVRLKVV